MINDIMLLKEEEISHGGLHSADSKSSLLKRRSSVAPNHAVHTGRKRKLVLHFDIRNTILVADSVTNVSVEHALNSFLTGVTWGKEVEGKWQWQSDQVSLKPPGNDQLLTYYKYLEGRLVRTPSDRKDLRIQTGDFTQSSIGKDFKPNFERHMNLLKWDHEYDESRDQKLTMSGLDGKRYHYVIPSFYKLIHFLKSKHRDFSIILRTYGLDAPNVLESMAYGLKGNHPGFSQSLNIPIHKRTGNIRRTNDGLIEMELLKSNGEILQKMNHERDMYRLFSRSEGIMAFKDDFQHWQNNSYSFSAGKPMWIDPTDASVHHIFFDDNFRSYEEDSIIDLRIFEDDVPKRARSLTHDEVARFEEMCLVQADLLESIENEDYFINRLAECENSYSKFLKDRDMDRSVAFNNLQPICVVVTKQPSRENILKLREELMKLDVGLLQDFQEYVIFPLRLVFKQTKTIEEDTYIKTCECLKYIFDNTTISNWQMVQDLFTTICFLINPPNGESKEESKSEEFMLILLNCLSSLITHTEWSTIQHLYEPSSLPALGHAVSVLLKEAELERSRSLQIAALNCLDSIAQTHRKVCRSERRTLGDILASFLPGISMALTRVITGDSKQGHAVIVKSLETWSKITSLVMNNEGLQDDNNITVKTHSRVNEKIKELMIKRNIEWFESTTSKLVILLKELVTIRTNSNWRVRMALVESADLLLKKCNRTMSKTVPILLDVLVGYIGDDYTNIRNKALATLDQFKQRQTDVLDSRALQEILAENLHNLTTALPRQIRMADEEEKLSIVNLLNGYLTLLGSDINKVLRSVAHLRRLFLSLVQSFELDCSDIRIIEHHTLTLDSTKDSDIRKPVKVFKHFRDNKIETGLYQTCCLLGQYGDSDVIVDHVLDIYHETSLYRLQAILIINKIVQGLSTTENNEERNERKMGIVRMLVEEYLSDANFDLPVTNIAPGGTNDSIQPKQTKPALTLANMNTNIMQICLILEGIGTFAKVTGREFNTMLIDVLYPVLEKLGQDNNYINNTAYLTLTDITTACHYRSIDELIRKNSDYLVNAISLKLRQRQDGYRAPQVLQVMIQYSSSEIIPLIHDTIQEILESLDDNYEEEILIYLNVLKELVISVNRWFPHKQENQANSKISTDKPHLYDDCQRFEKLSIEDIEKYFKEYHRNKEIEGNLSSLGEDVDEDGDEDPLVATDTTKQLPYHITAVQQILTRTKHLLSSTNGRHRLQVLQIIQHSVKALKHHQDELLPLLHELWVPFSLRFSDEEKLVTIKAMETLTIIVDNSGEFLMKRVVKNICPVIKQFLYSQAKISMKSGTMYSYTINYKLQLVYLQSLGHLAYMLKLQSYDLDVLVSSCLPYLSCHQHIALQQACLKTFNYLVKLDSDIVWLALYNIYRVTTITPPSTLFKHLILKGSEKDNNEYKENVKLLMLSIDNKI
ncbi:hypothetical protein LOTGIDRAFT_169160 [Lottia gigantea]|uniref:Uncharacterized protein n=1 Tax=Lottia gigantea TaxID=225164 RepID=V3ZMK5_LOTGI|nr:hypothetical protein LOTGIDRAFT_169160 [Lottia gigantea]ESO83680.1 hypothetical protein LOTGIDRAFT_169160 [Lottia gigantea]